MGLNTKKFNHQKAHRRAKQARKASSKTAPLSRVDKQQIDSHTRRSLHCNPNAPLAPSKKKMKKLERRARLARQLVEPTGTTSTTDKHTSMQLD